MCIGNPSESGHGGQFKPCKNYKELEHRYTLLQEKVERLKERLRDEPINTYDKGPAKEYIIFMNGFPNNNIILNGWYRRDLEKPNWHYYEDVDGSILHVRKEHMICVAEKEIKDDSDE